MHYQTLQCCTVGLLARVDHGPNSTCLGFRFGDVAYLSDLVHLAEESRHQLLSFGPIDLLIIDALFVERPNGSHFCTYHTLDLLLCKLIYIALSESLAEIRRLRPRQAMLVGMSHDFEYHAMNQKLKAMQETDNIHVECAYDGLIMEIPSLTKLLPGTPKIAVAAHDSS